MEYCRVPIDLLKTYLQHMEYDFGNNVRNESLDREEKERGELEKYLNSTTDSNTYENEFETIMGHIDDFIKRMPRMFPRYDGDDIKHDYLNEDFREDLRNYVKRQITK